MLRAEIARREASEERLRQAQKMEAVGRLTGGIAHDFNNLLTAIIGNLDLALRRLEGQDRVRGWLSNCRQAADRAATLVQRLLAFSRQHPLEVKSVDINRLVQNMSELLSRTIGETVTIETVLAGGLWNAAIDPNQLENAIVNLAVNARDAMPDGGRLTIETANCHLDEHYTEQAGADVTPGQYVMVAVSDSGSGMTREVMTRAFEPFFTTKPSGVGTGLGLSPGLRLRQAVRRTHPHLQRGRPGHDHQALFPALHRRRHSGVERAGAVARTGDQFRRHRDRARRGGRRAGQQARRRGAAGARLPGDLGERRAVRAAHAREGAPQIDLLLTDVVLPSGMNGRELTDAVLRLRPAVKVLYMTGYTRNAIIHHGRLDPDIDLLTKPFTADALARKLRRILDAHAPASAEPQAT